MMIWQERRWAGEYQREHACQSRAAVMRKRLVYGRGVLAMALLSMPTLSWGEWIEYGRGGDTIAYYDPARVRHESSYLTVWIRQEFDTPDRIEGKVYHSYTQKLALNCQTRDWGVQFTAFYSTKDQTGGPVHTLSRPLQSVSLQPAIPGSIGDSLISTVCPSGGSAFQIGPRIGLMVFRDAQGAIPLPLPRSAHRKMGARPLRGRAARDRGAVQGMGDCRPAGDSAGPGRPLLSSVPATHRACL